MKLLNCVHSWKSITSLIMMLVLLPSISLAAVWYVDGDVSNSGDGTSWAQAFKTIPESWNAAGSSDEIWVKQGIYDSLFLFGANIQLYGGFNGSEMDKHQRNWTKNVTIVGNSTFYQGAKGSVIDGFTFNGGIEINEVDTIALANCRVSNGDGISVNDSSLTITNCTISKNSSSGISSHISNITITNCEISDNDGYGIISNYNSELTVTNCKIFNNGGGISGDSHSMARITNSIISNNTGNAIDFSGDVGVTNCTFYNNGNQIIIGYTSYGYCSTLPDITNSIIWGTGHEIYKGDECSATVTYSNIEGGYAGTGNINADPLFVNVAAGDFRLKAGSPAIDSGTSTGAVPSTDIEGNSRPNGSGYDMGTYEMPRMIFVPGDFSTIQKAINAASTGDTIRVQAGTYTENINFHGKNIIVKSTDGPEKTVIDGNNSGSVVTFANEETEKATLSGFTLTNGTGTLLAEGYTHGGGIYVKNANPTLENLIILNNSVTSSGGGIHFEKSDTILSNSIIRNNIAGDDGGGISTAHSNVIIKNCLIAENKAKDIGGVVAGGGIRIHGYGNPHIINSTIANNSTPGSGGGGIMVYWNTSPVITNSIIYNNTGGEIKASNNANPVVTYSLVKGGYPGEGNLDADPLFANDYHLSKNSPAIGAGTAINAPNTDLDGNPRLNVNGSDIGAYQAFNAEQQRILQTINDVGYAYVIIGLHVDNYQPEGYYDSPEGVRKQRERVAEAQEQFVDNLVAALSSPRRRRPRAPVLNLNVEEFLKSVDKFKTVPQLFMKINRELFEIILERSLATNMWLNVADSVSLSDSTKIVGADDYLEQNQTVKGAWNKGYTGEGQYVVVLDSGIDSNHLALKDRVAEEACFSFVPEKYNNFSNWKTTCRDNDSVKCKNTNDVDINCGSSNVDKLYEESRHSYTTDVISNLEGAATPCTDSGNDCEHGTHVAGIIANTNTDLQGVAKKARIIAIQAGTVPDGSTVEFFRYSQQKALEYVITLNELDEYNGNIAAVNMSLNEKKNIDDSTPYLYKEFCDGIDDDMEDSRKQFIDNLYSYGIATVISSGNDGNNTKIASPACISSAISVGATDKNDKIWENSNRSDKLDLLAPGTNITSTWPDGGKKPGNGTSQAAPHVAGAFAILKQKLVETQNSDQDSNKHPTHKIVDIIEAALKLTGKPIPDGVDNAGNDRTFPRIQIDKAIEALNYHVYMDIGNGDEDKGQDVFPKPAKVTGWSGAAATQMVLNYLIDLKKAQDKIYSSESKDMTADEVKDALNLEVHKDLNGNGEEYYYVHLKSTSFADSVKKLVYWMDCVPNGGKNAPALVPIGNSYHQNWRVLRGFTSDVKPCSTDVDLADVTVTGFLLNNPTVASTEHGYYIYQNVKAFEKNHQEINGKFRIVVDPPFNDISTAEAALANVELTLGDSKPNEALQGFLGSTKKRRKAKNGQTDIDLLSAVIDAIPGELLVNPLLQPLVKEVKFVRHFIVDNLDTDTQYAIFTLSPNEGDTATILVEINPVDGSFASATWTATGQTYPSLSLAEAEQVAKQSANGNDKVQQIRRVWSNRLETSNFHFAYQVTFESGMIIYINSQGETSIEGVHSSFGYIHDKFGQPIADVIVQIVGHQNTTTDETGYWEIDSLTEGEYTVIASKTGYQFGKPQDFAIGNNILRTEVKLDKPVSLLRIAVIPEAHFVKQGQDFSYQITVTNVGEASLTGVILTDELPTNTQLVSVVSIDGNPCETDATQVVCVLPDLTPGATATVNIVINNTQADTLVNTAMVHSNEYPADLVKTWTKVKPYLSVSVEAVPEPVLPGGLLHYTQEIDLNHYAPISTATGIKLFTRLPQGVELQSINSDYAICDVSHLPTITCEVTDLSIANADSVSHISVNFDVVLKDLGLLLLTLESSVTAQEYPPHNVRTSTKVNVGDAEVDMVFVLDVTHSMQEEINGVIRAVKELLTTVDKNTWPLIALVTFRDDVTVKAVTQDSDLLIKAIDNIQVSGGGTCPEASAEALKIAIEHTKVGGTILLATDASPYNSTDIEELVTRLLNKGIRLNALITGDCTMKDSWNVIPIENRL